MPTTSNVNRHSTLAFSAGCLGVTAKWDDVRRLWTSSLWIVVAVLDPPKISYLAFVDQPTDDEVDQLSQVDVEGTVWDFNS